MNACKDCKHFFSGDGYACTHPETSIPDFVYGSVAADIRTARTNQCGEDGRLFERRARLSEKIKSIFRRA